MIFQRIKRTMFERGFLLTLILSIAFLVWGYGRLLEAPNSKYFAASGDGLQAYYGAVYHIKHDDSYWRSYGMNHPYGEQVFFTGGQPLVANILKLISKVVDLSDHTIGILNLIMLFSIVACALSLYLILKYFRVNWVYAALASVAIAFLSPQIDRLGGHYSLTYQFAIPLFLYGLLKFHEAPSIKRSLAIGLLCFFIAGTHFYFFAFYGLLAFFYWAVLFFSGEGDFGRFRFVLKHLLIQMIVPFLLIQGLILLTDPVQDRTIYPAGFFLYVSNFFGVFFPPPGAYSDLFTKFAEPVFPEWEGRAYIGVVAVLAMIGIVGLVLKNFMNKEYSRLLNVANHRLLNIFFWASFVALLLAFGHPFIGNKHLLEIAGPIKQFRGVGRFAWPFFYVINIIAFYKIYYWAMNKRAVPRYLLLAGTVYLVSFDAWKNNENKEMKFNNEIPELNDTKNELPENNWITELNVQEYQAIIPLPYFFVGSENITISTESESVRDAFVASIKTGLPLTATILSRVSMSQANKNMAMIKEPYRKLQYVSDLKSRKPFLVIAREGELNIDEKRFLSKCKKIKETPRFNLYRMEVETLEQISDGLYAEAKRMLDSSRVYPQDGFLSTDSLKRFVYKGFEDGKGRGCLEGKGCYEGELIHYNELFFDTVPGWADEEYTLSFWMDRFTTDIYPRAVIELAFVDGEGRTYGSKYFNPSEGHRLVYQSWGLIESTFHLKSAKDKMKVTVWTDSYLKKDMLLRVDELLIRPSATNVYKHVGPEKITVNNRTYLAKQNDLP